MGYFVAVLVVVCGILFRSSKLLTAFVCLYLCSLIALNTDSPDYDNYKAIYNSIHSLYYIFEPGFAGLCIFCKDILGLEFIGFRTISGIVIVFCIYNTISIYTYNKNFVLVLYLMTPFILYISGLRIALALTVASCFFKYLIESDEKYSVIKYTIGIIIAASFHYCVLFYLILPLCRMPIKPLIIVAVFASFGIIILFKEGVLFELISDLSFLPPRVQKWFIFDTLHEYTKPKVLAVMLLLQCAMICCMEIVERNLRRFVCDGGLRLPRTRLTDAGIAVWVRVNYVVLMAVPLSYIMTGFSRLFYGVLLVNYSIVGAALSILPDVCLARDVVLSKGVFILGVLMLASMFFIFYVCILYHYTTFFPSLLCNNMIFSW